MLTQKQRSDMRDGISAMGESTARVWVRKLLDHAAKMDAENAALVGALRPIADLWNKVPKWMQDSALENGRITVDGAKIATADAIFFKNASDTLIRFDERRDAEPKERLESEWVALREVARTARRFAAYTQVLEVLASEDRKRTGSTNGWDNLDPILGAKGQLLTLGDFRLLRAALARCDEVTHG